MIKKWVDRHLKMILRLNSEHFQISEQKDDCIHQNSALKLNFGQFEICERKYIGFAMITM